MEKNLSGVGAAGAASIVQAVRDRLVTLHRRGMSWADIAAIAGGGDREGGAEFIERLAMHDGALLEPLARIVKEALEKPAPGILVGGVHPTTEALALANAAHVYRGKAGLNNLERDLDVSILKAGDVDVTDAVGVAKITSQVHEELKAMKFALGSWSKVADNLGIDCAPLEIRAMAMGEKTISIAVAAAVLGSVEVSAGYMSRHVVTDVKAPAKRSMRIQDAYPDAFADEPAPAAAVEPKGKHLTVSSNKASESLRAALQEAVRDRISEKITAGQLHSTISKGMRLPLWCSNGTRAVVMICNGDVILTIAELVDMLPGLGMTMHVVIEEM